jgi:YfiH family protein
MNSRICTTVAVGRLDFRIYSVEKARSEFLDRLPDALVLDYINADTNNHDARMLQANRISQITVLTEPALSSIPGIVHAFSTRRAEHNEFTLGPFSSENPAIAMNRARFLAAVGMTGWPLLKLKQTHSDTIHVLRDTMAASQRVEGDAAITEVSGFAVGIQTADCAPILIADKQARVVAAIHAGWRGTAARIAYKTVTRIFDAYGIAAVDLVAAVGPHNAVCCYEVGEEVVEAVSDPSAIVRKPEWAKPHLNQGAANRNQLVAAGIPEDQVLVSSLCTQCRADLFYSYRREGKRAGRLLSVIGILP